MLKQYFLPNNTDMAVKNESNLKLAELIKTHRKRAGLSQKELADLAGVGKALIFDLEKGHEKLQLDKLKSILQVLNIKIAFQPPRLPGESGDE